MDVLNRDCFEGPKAAKWFETARGFSNEEGGSFNGGIVSPQREHLRPGQNFYRFVSAGVPEEKKVGGVWWIDGEVLNNIYRRYLETGPNPNARRLHGSGPAASTFREWLALTYEWNSIQEIVIAPLWARLDAWTGAARVACGGHVFDKRGYGYAPHLAHMFGIKQLCVPEVWVHRQAAFPHYKIVPFRKIEAVARGEIF